MKYLASVSNRM